jgi:hypothetical protein
LLLLSLLLLLLVLFLLLLVLSLLLLLLLCLLLLVRGVVVGCVLLSVSSVVGVAVAVDGGSCQLLFSLML